MPSAWEVARELLRARELERLQANGRNRTVATVPFIPTKPALENEHSETLRLTSSTGTIQTLTFRSGFNGTLEGITVFNSAIDPGDYWTVSLRGRIIRETAYPVANTALKEDFALPINAGDSLVLTYYSQGSTLKRVDFTPRISYRGEGF